MRNAHAWPQHWRLEELCKRIQHMLRTFWRSRNKRNVGILTFPLFRDRQNVAQHMLYPFAQLFQQSWGAGSKVWPVPTFSQQLPTTRNRHAATCNRLCKRTFPVTSNNVGSCWPTILRPFAWDLTRVTSLLLFQVLGCHIVWAYRRTVSFSMLWRTSDEGYVYSDHYKTGAIQSAF